MLSTLETFDPLQSACVSFLAASNCFDLWAQLQHEAAAPHRELEGLKASQALTRQSKQV